MYDVDADPPDYARPPSSASRCQAVGRGGVSSCAERADEGDALPEPRDEPVPDIAPPSYVKQKELATLSGNQCEGKVTRYYDIAETAEEVLPMDPFVVKNVDWSPSSTSPVMGVGDIPPCPSLLPAIEISAPDEYSSPAPDEHSSCSTGGTFDLVEAGYDLASEKQLATSTTHIKQKNSQSIASDKASAPQIKKESLRSVHGYAGSEGDLVASKLQIEKQSFGTQPVLTDVDRCQVPEECLAASTLQVTDSALRNGEESHGSTTVPVMDLTSVATEVTGTRRNAVHAEGMLLDIQKAMQLSTKKEECSCLVVMQDVASQHTEPQDEPAPQPPAPNLFSLNEEPLDEPPPQPPPSNMITLRGSVLQEARASDNGQWSYWQESQPASHRI
jgi:hypothetical protein